MNEETTSWLPWFSLQLNCLVICSSTGGERGTSTVTLSSEKKRFDNRAPCVVQAMVSNELSDRWWGQFVFVRASYISRPLPVTTRWAWFPNHRSNSPQDRDCREESGFKSSTSSFLVQENICHCQPELVFPPLPLQKPSFSFMYIFHFGDLVFQNGSDFV